MENRSNTEENDPNAMEIDRVREITNKHPRKHKLSKKEKEWSKLEASKVLGEKICKPNEIEKKYAFIKHNSDLLMTKSECLTLEKIITDSSFK